MAIQNNIIKTEEKKMRMKRVLSAGLLSTMVVMSMGTVAQAYNQKVYNESVSFSDFSDGPQYTSYENKDTSSSIYLSYNWGSAHNYEGAPRIRFGTMGAVYSDGSDSIDVSDGHYYDLNEGESTGSMYNFVNEWGYNYAAIQASTFDDSAATINISWRLDN